MVAVRQGEREIRTMELSDLDDVLSIEGRCYDYPWSPGIFRDCLRAGYSCVVATLDDFVVGYGIFQFSAGEAHILNICTDPLYQRQGFAREMLHGLFAAMDNMGVETVYLEVRPSNLNAINLYLDEGFNEVGTRKAYYRGRYGREDALIMARCSPQ
ncbi:MAG: ribosomal protein S18-alanine N-acetyltransferase [Pseudomonadota bacterium]